MDVMSLLSGIVRNINVGKFRLSRQPSPSTAFLLLLLASMVSLSHAASSGAYIDALNAEISGPPPEVDTAADKNKEGKASLIGSGKYSLSSELPPGLSPEDFEAELKNSFIGSFVFYNKLNSTDKEAVYNYYKQTNNIDDIRDRIKALLIK